MYDGRDITTDEALEIAERALPPALRQSARGICDPNSWTPRCKNCGGKGYVGEDKLRESQKWLTQYKDVLKGRYTCSECGGTGNDPAYEIKY